MMVVHEAGHVLHLLATGGSIEQITLHPLKLSHTLPDANPHPLMTVLGGPLWGVLLPVLFWWIVGRILPTRSYLAAFFAGFCLVANGAYLVGDAILQGGDGREFVQHGVPPWVLVLAGLPIAAAGLWVWNGLGSHFGFGESRGRVSRGDAYAMTALTLVLILAELALTRSGSVPAPFPVSVPISVAATKLQIAPGSRSWKSESLARRTSFLRDNNRHARQKGKFGDSLSRWYHRGIPRDLPPGAFSGAHPVPPRSRLTPYRHTGLTVRCFAWIHRPCLAFDDQFDARAPDLTCSPRPC